MNRSKDQPIERIALPLATVALVIISWHLSVAVTHTRVFPSPRAVAQGLLALVQQGLLLRYLRDSLLRVAIGYLLAVAVGVPLGTAMGTCRSLGVAVNPVIQLIRPISPLAWIPIAIVLFGIGNVATVFLIFLGAVCPITMASMNGVTTVPAMYLLAGRNMGLSRVALLARVILPASMPQIIIGLRIALGVAWIVVVAAEMIAIDSGLGYLIIDARNAGKRYDLVVSGMILIGLVGLVLDTLVRQLERMKRARWAFRFE